MGTGGNQHSADVVAHDDLAMRTDSPRASSPGLPLQRERRDSDRGNPLVTGVHSRHGFSGASQLQGTALVRSPGSPSRHGGGGRRVRARRAGGEQPREAVAASELEDGVRERAARSGGQDGQLGERGRESRDSSGMESEADRNVRMEENLAPAPAA